MAHKEQQEFCNRIKKEYPNYLTNNINVQYSKEEFKDDIFVIDSWPDNESKEDSLISLIKMLKTYNATILLSGHYPIKPEIQEMVDFYLFDKNNPILTFEEFAGYDVDSSRWTMFNGVKVNNKYKFHHDFAIWETMRNTFNFAQYLGKKYIHFLEYDNLPDPVQYRQAFIEKIREHDVVLYEYHNQSLKDVHLGPYCATFIFSIKTDVGVKVIDRIKTKEEYFYNHPNGWQLERTFLAEVKQVTSDIYVSPYIANDNELNTQAVWDRDGLDRNGARMQLYLAVDEVDNLYLHTISGFHELPAKEDYLIEVVYDEYKKFQDVIRGQYGLYNIGKYKKGQTVRIYYEGVEVFSEYLGDDINQFRLLNSLTKPNSESSTPGELNINFIDGAFVEIKHNIEKEYDVEFINNKTDEGVFKTRIKSNHWCKPNIKYQIDWKILVNSIDSDYSFEHIYDPTDKRVLISFESKSLGDTLAWIPQVEKFRKEKRCELICSTFHNKLFKEQYPEIQFVDPGSNVNNVYSLFRIGLFKDNNKFESDKHPSDPKKLPLGKICSDILGLEYEELRPKLSQLGGEKQKVVSIATHATAQCKYWNNPTGWQEVVDYLISEGYEVKLLSSEGNGYMGNIDPKNVTKVPPGSIENIIKIIQESEFFIGLSSGLSWLSWAAGTETILISGFSDVIVEPIKDVHRVINKNVCHGCWGRYEFDPGDWNWCPDHKGTKRQFECSKTITSQDVIEIIKSRR